MAPQIRVIPNAAPLARSKSRHARYTLGHCRRCGAFELHRTRAKTLAHQLATALTPLVPLRCPACGTRTLRFPSAAKPRPDAPGVLIVSKRVRASSRRAARKRRRMARFVAFYGVVLSIAAAMGYFASRV